MAQLDVLKTLAAVQQRLVDFALDECFVRDPQVTHACKELWSGDAASGGLVSDLWVEAAFPATVPLDSPRTLRDFVEKGSFNRDLADHLDRMKVFPRERDLYTHQRDALMKATPRGDRRPAIVVTAGTGAGKTECFLLPILHQLYAQPRATGAGGVRCVLLYPMNALVNDQVDRLYQWLQGQTRVTLFHFTSETPEKGSDFFTQFPRLWERCRFNTRQHARGLERVQGDRLQRVRINDGEQRGPTPDILITNYSMLEYMLCRPQDAVFFGPALEAFVLDEAHLYTGTLAAEITLLMRRVLQRCERTSDQVLQVATSATLGRETLESFAATLFTKDRDLVEVVHGESRRPELVRDPASPIPTLEEFSARPWLQIETLRLDDEGKTKLAIESDQSRWQSLLDDLKLLAVPSLVDKWAITAEREPATLLFDVLRTSSLAEKLVGILFNYRHLPIGDLARRLWGSDADDAKKATTKLLQMAAAARCAPADYPLVPHRLHVLARAPDGICLCVNSACTSSAPKLVGFGRVVAGWQPRCPDCNAVALSLHRCTHCGEHLLAGRDKDFRLEAVGPTGGEMPNNRARLVLLTPTEVAGAPNEVRLRRLEASTGETVGEKAADVTPLYDITNFVVTQGCPNCGEGRGERSTSFRPFTLPPSLTLSILAETLLAQLPEYPAELEQRQILPARGRRLLTFTDGRQGAARLGPRLTSQHERQLLRAAILRELPERPDADIIQALEARQADLKQKLAQSEGSHALKAMWADDLREVERKLTAARQGREVHSLVHGLADLPEVAELMDRALAEDAQRQKCPWQLSHWDENANAIWKDLPRRVKAEFAAPIRRSRVGGLETLGLAEVIYPGIETIIPPDELVGSFPAVAEVWTDLLKACCDSLRSDGAVTLGTEREDEVYNDVGGARIGKHEGRKDFVGEQDRQRRRSLVLHFLESRGVLEASRRSLGSDILASAWDALHSRSTPMEGPARTGALPWLQADRTDTAGGLRINLNHIALRRPAALYQSRRTHHVFPHAVRCAKGMDSEAVYSSVEAGCTDLRSTSHRLLDEDPRLGRRRRELEGKLSSPYLFRMGLWAEEHTAQLSASENRRLQDLFKCGARNVLSSTTTLELGIDIGGLSCVFLTDVPPGKANYLQRAGRAGRRADGSSLVVTFARPRPYDRHVFADFARYLDVPLRNPSVFLERRRISERHAHAFLLGEFFRGLYSPDDRTGAMSAFKLMGVFCGAALPRWWADEPVRPLPHPAEIPEAGRLYTAFQTFLRTIADNPQHELRTCLVTLLDGCDGLKVGAAEGGIMTEFLREIPNCLMDQAVGPWLRDYKQMFGAWELAAEKAAANAICKNCEALYEVTTIEALADAQFLPRYGFPIGVLPLRVFEAQPDKRGRLRVREEDQYRLERPGLLALREYTPGQSVIAGGKTLRSRGLLKHWTGADLQAALGLRGHSGECKHKHFHFRRDGILADQCPVCQEPTVPASRHKLFFPKHGFSTAWWDSAKRASDTEPVGSVRVATTAFVEGEAGELANDRFAGIPGLRLRLREGGTLLVYNQGYLEDQDGGGVGCGFAICTLCGYAEPERRANRDGLQDLTTEFLRHRPLRRVAGSPSASCWRASQSHVLRNEVLASEQVTDIILLDLAAWDVSPELGETLATALRLGGARHLQLDSRELGSLVAATGHLGQGTGIVLFDNHPGGAGHVLELTKQGAEWLETTFKEVLFISEEHHSCCQSACLRCLLTFDSQPLESDVEMDRLSAYEFLRLRFADAGRF